MEQEIIKHTNKMYVNAKNSKYKFSEKIKAITIEIFIIVFAVTLSISLHSWNEHRHEQKVVKKFIKSIKEDLKKDIQLLQHNKLAAVIQDSNYTFLLSVTGTKNNDSLLTNKIHRHLTYNLTTTHLNIGRYDGFKFSGKIETIENDRLKKKNYHFTS